VALALPFVLGIGMAIPWPIAGAGLSSLPKPGPWMVRVKQAFGVLILGTAVYYGYLAYELFSSRWVDATEVASSVEEKLKEGWHSSLARCSCGPARSCRRRTLHHRRRSPSMSLRTKAISQVPRRSVPW